MADVPNSSPDPQVGKDGVTLEALLFKTFGEALGIGFLIGVERYKDRGADERRSAGVRTFSMCRPSAIRDT
jgi:hypothetical protein